MCIIRQHFNKDKKKKLIQGNPILYRLVHLKNSIYSFQYLCRKKFNLKNGLTFDDDGIFRMIDAAADWADGEKKKMNGRQGENCKTRKSRHSRRHVQSQQNLSDELHVRDDAQI